MTDRAGPISLNEAAAHMGWGRRTLTRALARHGIPTIGTGRRARIEPADLEALKAKERACRSTLPEPEKETGPTSFDGGTTGGFSERRYWKRRLSQERRQKRDAAFPGSKVIALARP